MTERIPTDEPETSDSRVQARPRNGALVALILLNSIVAVASLALVLLHLRDHPHSKEAPGDRARIESQTAPPKDPAPDKSGARLASRLVALENAVQELKNVAGGRSPEIVDLLGRMDRLEQDSRERNGKFAQLLDRVVKLQNAFEALTTPPPEEDSKEVSIAESIEQLAVGLEELGQEFDDQFEIFANHVHTVELRDLHRGWNHAFPGWASDNLGLRFDTSERRLSRPLPFDSKKAVWSDSGFGAGATKKKNR